MADLDLTHDARLARLAWPIGWSTALSTLTGLTDAVATAGLAAYLASGLGDVGAAMGGPAWLAEPLAIAIFTVITFGLNVVNALLREKLGANWEADRRHDLVNAYADAEFAAQRDHSGAALTVVNEQLNIASGSIGNLIGLINNVIRTFIYIAAAFATSWQVSIIALVAGGTLVVGLRLISLQTRKLVRRSAGESAEIGEAIGDMAAASRELHLLDRWSEAVDSTGVRIELVRRLRYRARSFATMVGPIFALGTGFVGLAVGLLNQRGPGVDVPSLAASGFLLIRALGAAQSSQTSYQQYHDSMPYVDRVLDLIAVLRTARRHGSDIPKTDELSIGLRGASISHGNDVVVHSIDLEFAGIGGIAIVGQSGSGKSTTLLALSGLITPSAGTVEFCGTDLAEIDRRELGRRVGLLPQDPHLLRNTLRSNLARPDVELGDDELAEMLDAVGLTETVDGFDSGLDTVMGRGSEGFSGGELQRLGLARLATNRPDVWLLDEPTSALDRQNAERASKLITEAMQDRLVILVTHRPELLHHCDRVVYMADGRVVDDGDLETVRARQPFVASMLEGTEAESPAEGVHG